MSYARYKVFLRDIMKDEKSMQAINKALSTYPLYIAPKTYDLIPTREELNKKLLNHYKYREIGFETVGRFIDELEITMNEIMPRYNELFKTVVTMAELPSPFDNVDVIETYKETRTDNSSTTGTTTSTASSEGSGSESSEASETSTRDHTRLFSDTPQNSIDNINNYLTDHTKENTDNTNNTESLNTSTTSNSSEGSETSNSSSEGTTTVEHTYTKTGNQGVNTYAHDMNEFRTSIIDVVDQIINDVRINELFMMVY